MTSVRGGLTVRLPYAISPNVAPPSYPLQGYGVLIEGAIDSGLSG